MSLRFLKAGTADAVSLMCISKKAFNKEVLRFVFENTEIDRLNGRADSMEDR